MPVRFKKCDDDVRIVHLGSVLISKTSNILKPLIEIWGYPSQRDNGFKVTNFANIPILYRGCILNRKDKREYYQARETVTIPSGRKIESGSLDYFPELSKVDSVKYVESRQKAFVLSGIKGRTYVIPQLELARALFYHSSYLARASLTSSTLGLDFNVVREDYSPTVNIYVLKTASFPISAFNDSATRSVLSWILLNEKIRSSFESINRSFSTQCKEVGGFKKWTFEFEPPDMAGWEFNFNGRFDSSKNSFFVEKIRSFTADSRMPSKILYHHPDFTRVDPSLPAKGGRKYKKIDRPPEEHTIDDESEASNTNKVFQVGNTKVRVNFKRPFETNTVKRDVRPTKGKGPIKPGNKLNGDVSTGEPGNNGDIPSADAGGGTEDGSDKSIQYADRFQAFDMMIKALINREEGFSMVASATHELPKVGRSKCHLMLDGTSRAIRYVCIKKDDWFSYLIEVDTSDSGKKLSTQCIRLVDGFAWESLFLGIKIGLVENSINWPNDLFDKRVGRDNHWRINHPKSVEITTSNGIPTASISDWAKRVAKRL